MCRPRYYSLLQWRKQIPALVNRISEMGFGKYDNYLILDFESTCDKVKIEKQEIIEFPCIWVDSNLNTISTFHRYVKPIHNPILTPYCTQLTGIVQGMVENEETFDKVLASFLRWMKESEALIGNNQSKIFMTCGDWDLKVMLRDQCRLSDLPVPTEMTNWLNLKKVFYEMTNYYPKSLQDMCRFLDIKFSGRMHSGIDDCRNILEILKHLRKRYLTPVLK